MSAPDNPPGLGDFASMENFKLARRAAKAHNLQPATARLVLLSVAVYVNGDPARAGYPRLADDTALGIRQVRRLIDALVAAGYLTETRRPDARGGWGQPQWTLGPLCRVDTPVHLTPMSTRQEQVDTHVTASGHASPLASGHPRPQKRRESVDQVGGVVQSDGGGETPAAGKREGEERGTRPPTNKNSIVIDLLKAAGFHPALKEPDHQAIKKAADLTAEQIVEVYTAIARTPFGDDFMRRGLTVAKAIGAWDGYDGWKQLQAGPAPTNGVKRGAAAVDQMLARRRATPPPH